MNTLTAQQIGEPRALARQTGSKSGDAARATLAAHRIPIDSKNQSGAIQLVTQADSKPAVGQSDPDWA